MNLQLLRYVVEVERTGSITRAAQNLYMGQPNLSKAIKELEQEIGLSIFRRTPKGVEPTRRGAEFLSYAATILSQVDELESLYHPQNDRTVRLRLAVPRASYVSVTFADLVGELVEEDQLEIDFKETSSMEIMQRVNTQESDLGIIRFQTIYEKYFMGALRDLKLDSTPIWDVKLELLMSQDHPLASCKEVPYHTLSGYTEIVHGDFRVPSLSFGQISVTPDPVLPPKRIYVYERGSQFDLLQQVPSTFMWVSPIPAPLLNRYKLVTRPCAVSNIANRDLFVYRKGHEFSAQEEHFMELVKRQTAVLSE